MAPYTFKIMESSSFLSTSGPTYPSHFVSFPFVSTRGLLFRSHGLNLTQSNWTLRMFYKTEATTVYRPRLSHTSVCQLSQGSPTIFPFIANRVPESYYGHRGMAFWCSFLRPSRLCSPQNIKVTTMYFLPLSSRFDRALWNECSVGEMQRRFPTLASTIYFRRYSPKAAVTPHRHLGLGCAPLAPKESAA